MSPINSFRSPAAESRRVLYKKGSPCSADWKNEFKSRCSSRLKSSRSKLLDRYRNLSINDNNDAIEQVVLDEWKSMISSGCHNAGSNGDFDAYLQIVEQVKQELLQEELESIQEYETRGLEADIDHFQNINSNSFQADVLCPVCSRNYFSLQFGVFACPCGVKLKPENPQATLADLQSRFETIFNSHMTSSSCRRRLNAAAMLVSDGTHYNNIAFTCSYCDFFDVLL